ncbi:hypothetical protein DSECCO2_600990 [anaerobic digester metagenome]
MMDESAGQLKVKGSASVMATFAPSPGSAPMIMPMAVPTKPMMIFLKVMEIKKPSNIIYKAPPFI